jgi:hypothetical protein
LDEGQRIAERNGKNETIENHQRDVQRENLKSSLPYLKALVDVVVVVAVVVLVTINF